MGGGAQTHSPFIPNGRSILPAGESAAVDWRTVSPGFFRTMGIPLFSGRDFSEQDTPQSQEPIILSRRAARIYWGDEDPIGKSLHRPNTTLNFTVVGVAGDVRNTALNQESPTLYYPTARFLASVMDVVVRVDGSPEMVLPAVRQKVHEMDALLPLSNVRTMNEWIANNAAQPRLNAQLLGAFAVVALAIAAIGIYGLLAYSVNQRTREIGLRMALGAPRGRVLRLIIGEGMTVAAAGIAAGLATSLALSRALKSLVFEVPVDDPATFSSVAIVLTLVALLACAIPARRASRVDPMVALREE